MLCYFHSSEFPLREEETTPVNPLPFFRVLVIPSYELVELLRLSGLQIGLTRFAAAAEVAWASPA